MQSAEKELDDDKGNRQDVMPNFSTSEWSFSVDKKLAIIYAIGSAVKKISKWYPVVDSTSYTVNNATRCNAKTLIFREIIAAKVMISCIMVAWFQRGYFSRLRYKNGMTFQHHGRRNTQQSLIILQKTRLGFHGFSLIFDKRNPIQFQNHWHRNTRNAW